MKIGNVHGMRMKMVVPRKEEFFGGPNTPKFCIFFAPQITSGHLGRDTTLLIPSTRLPCTRPSWHKKRYIFSNTLLSASPSPYPRTMALSLLLITLTDGLIDRENQCSQLSARRRRRYSSSAHRGEQRLCTRGSSHTS